MHCYECSNSVLASDEQSVSISHYLYVWLILKRLCENAFVK